MKSIGSLSDAELLELIKCNDSIAFAEAYERYWMVIYSHVLRMLNKEDDAKDVVQEVFTTLWLKASQIQGEINLPGYLYTTARHKVINLMRHEQVRNGYIGSLQAYLSSISNVTVEQLDERDLQDAVEREVQTLPDKMRQVYELSRKNNLSYKEISVHLNISDKTVKKQISNALKILRLRLDFWGSIFFCLTSLLL
jgi:RNA polymerase sigma-70 factor (ECF subfamily)